MAMKTRDYFAILVTSILLSYFEMLSRKTLHSYNLSHNDKDTCNHNHDFSLSLGSHGPANDRWPSPNSRCGFATGDAC